MSISKMNTTSVSVVLTLVIYSCFVHAQSGDSSFDSLVASQCRARCLSLHPWQEQPPISSAYQALRYFQKRDLSATRYVRQNGRQHNRNQRGHLRWKKIMEMCSKNENCLQCTLPCDIPNNLLANCKYLCKNNNKLCQDSCDLLARLNQEKYGACPSFIDEPANTIQLLISSKGQLAECSEQTKTNAVAALHNNNNNLATEDETDKAVVTCGQDSDCGDIKKCCPLHSACPQYGNVCAKPIVTSPDMSSAPFNLSIVERKKGKTIILKWDCNYKRNKPTIFVVEGRWSLKSPQATIAHTDAHMTKWGYLAQTVNNNWIILRNINRGRWYKFRVSSITKDGTLGYSKPTPLFILSSAPKPPSQPQNLTVQSIQMTPSGLTADFTWLPSRRSDLPISHYKLTWRQENSNSPHYGFDIISNTDIDLTNTKYTVKNLLANTVYSLELTAVASYEGRELKSGPCRVQIDTGSVGTVSHSSSHLVSEPEYVDDDDDNEDAENVNDNNDEEYESVVHQHQAQQQETRNVENRIRDLTVQRPYFRNGLVKAKLAWQYSATESTLNANSASINSIVVEQAMFTITWFPIKCLQQKLPTPITATTINTHFEIYELKYNCDYVINVRLESRSNTGGVSSSLNPAPPQIASAQFKVPSCSDVEILGRIRPRCFEKIDLDVQKTTPSPDTTSKSILLPRFTTIQTTQSTTTVVQLPRVYNIRHRIAGQSAEFYSVEFTWSLAEYFREASLFSGYQISVVPKAIPGFGGSNADEGLVTFGSVGAIVDKEHNSFVVKQLRASVKYIFQIQLIALDNQSYGPAASLEFKINPVEVGRTTETNRFYSVYNEDGYEENSGFNLYNRVENYLRTTARPEVAVSGCDSLVKLHWIGVVLLGLQILINQLR